VIKGISFDLWDTMIRDDSDEPKRAARGLRPKHDERRHLVWDALNQVEPIPYETVKLAYDVAEAAFYHVWHHQFVTWTVSQRIEVMLKGLGRRLPEAAFAAVVRAHEEMEVDIPPDPVDGIREALAELAQRYRLCVVSDTLVSPSRSLRRLLDLHGLKDYFTGFAFSDEVGRSKPDPEMFASAARQLGVNLDQMVHVGDREHNDIRGPHRLGMKAVLFVAARANDKDHTTADAICERARDLPAIIDRLAQSR
jgi:HAD superfamily hydrolase (TIGR01549 family)